MREAVSCIFIYKDKIFSVKRAHHLKVFPGYHAFPGGKVDKEDGKDVEDEVRLRNALEREMKEELSFDISGLKTRLLGKAITPSFNPYRFKTYYYAIKLDQKPEFVVDRGEAMSDSWETPRELLDQYEKAELLVVPPMLMILKSLAKDLNSSDILDFSLPDDDEDHVPLIESIFGVKHFLPLSNTFPPARRTNSFLIGDEGVEVLVDPSPKDEKEREKFFRTLEKFNVSKIFITHHHPDHHEYLGDFQKKFNVPVAMGVLTKSLLEKKYGSDYLKSMDIELYQEGDELTKSLGKAVHVYEVPGHDQGQLALAPETMNWFLVGDLIQTVGTVLVGGDNANMTDYYESLQKVINLSPRFCIPSHGISIGGTYKVEKTLNHRKMRESEIADLLKKGHNIDQIVAFIYEGLDERLLKYAKATVLCHMDRLATLR